MVVYNTFTYQYAISYDNHGCQYLFTSMYGQIGLKSLNKNISLLNLDHPFIVSPSLHSLYTLIMLTYWPIRHLLPHVNKAHYSLLALGYVPQ